jgi:hypothetical protein
LVLLIVTLLSVVTPAAPVLAESNVLPSVVIAKANSRQHMGCFSDGVQEFWRGTYFWKMPDDV